MQNMKSMMMPMLIMLILVVSGVSFAWQGVSMQNRVAGEEAVFHKLQSEYFILSKATRESAVDGAELNQKLVQIQNYPSALMELKLIGVGKILTGIFFALLTIGFLLFMMPIRLAKLIKENK